MRKKPEKDRGSKDEKNLIGHLFTAIDEKQL